MGNGEPKEAIKTQSPQETDLSIKRKERKIINQVLSLHEKNSATISDILAYKEIEDTDRLDYKIIQRFFEDGETIENLIKITYNVNQLLAQLPVRYLYHCKAHTVEDVVPRAMTLASQHGRTILSEKMGGSLNEKEMELLYIAAICHDIGYLISPIDNERFGAMYAEQLMKKLGYDDEEIRIVKKAIMSTNLKIGPETLLENVLCDADMGHLADPYPEFRKKNHALFEELKECKVIPKKMSYKERLSEQPKFFALHGYYTKVAQVLLNQRKAKNLAQVQKELEEIDNKTKSK